MTALVSLSQPWNKNDNDVTLIYTYLVKKNQEEKFKKNKNIASSGKGFYRNKMIITYKSNEACWMEELQYF